MLKSILKFFCGCTVLTQFGSIAAAQEQLPQPEKPIEQFEYMEGEKSWPPELKGIKDIKVLPADEILASAVTPSFQRRAEEIAMQSAELRRQLGDRYAAMGASIPELSKDELKVSLEQQPAEVMFYSYSRNVAVAAVVRNGEFISSRDIEGYQPPETPEEIEVATRLALSDSRLKQIGDEYQPRGLITELAEGQAGHGNRLLYVSFEKKGSAIADYFALVDLTANVVIDAGQTAGNK